ncbi:MAG: class I SAM-dependent methyltransferase [Hyphomicrobiaceae bacterium]|nr:class I SAM-dependent methyltransferase [Hyphomicrobiaceae bacterium]
MSDLQLDAGSFRDPRGHVFHAGSKVFRTLSEKAADDFDFVQSSGLLGSLEDIGRVVKTQEVSRTDFETAGVTAHRVLEHERIPFISYPYEWSFSLLKAAALHHLEVQMEAFDRGVSMSDASAYNVQFVGPKPTFIDILSFKKYEEGEVWAGHRQFCNQFLNPLLLRSITGVPHNSWYRGNLEGIETEQLNALLPMWRKMSINMLSHVVLPTRMQKSAVDSSKQTKAAQATKLSKNAYKGILQQLHGWIKKLEPAGASSTTWQNYAEVNTYSDDEAKAKAAFITEFCESVQPDMLFDLGCNTGEYCEVALSAGAKRAVGFDFDQGALERAYARAKDKNLELLPLYLDAANPSPDQGWNMKERPGLTTRCKADAVMALAFEHHLAIARNIPLDQVVDWLVGMAPTGVIEFVHKDDPTVQQLLALREDIFDNYTSEAFEAAIEKRAKIVKKQVVASTGRTLYWFDRRG